LFLGLGFGLLLLFCFCFSFVEEEKVVVFSPRHFLLAPREGKKSTVQKRRERKKQN